MSASAPQVVTLGEALVLFAANETGPLDRVKQFNKHAAGAETNVATGLARMGIHTAWVSRLGNDSLGHFLLSHMQAENIDCSHVQMQLDGKTAFMLKTRQDDGGDPTIEYHRSNSAASHLKPEDIDIPWLTSARHLHISGVFPALSESTLAATKLAMRVMRNAGRTISFDPNLRPALWGKEERMRAVIDELCAMADWVLPGLSEAQRLTGHQSVHEITAHYLNRGAQRVIIKCGADAAWFQERGAPTPSCVKACSVERVVDTVGAGDAFAVGVISALLEGLETAAAVRRGHWMGSRVIQSQGDSEGQPTREQWQQSGID